MSENPEKRFEILIGTPNTQRIRNRSKRGHKQAGAKEIVADVAEAFVAANEEGLGRLVGVIGRIAEQLDDAYRGPSNVTLKMSVDLNAKLDVRILSGSASGAIQVEITNKGSGNE